MAERSPQGPLVLLLRGVNVGTGHRVAMADLRSLLGDLGYPDARTHLQSGNVALDAGPRQSGAVVRQVESALADRFGFEIPVVARTSAELAEVVATNPLADVATDPARYVVTFLPMAPSKAAVSSVGDRDFGQEQFVVRGREVYQWCPGGQHESPLVKALGKARVTTAGTARNWRTVTRILDLTKA